MTARIILFCLLACSAPASARTIFVDNVGGDDRLNGRSEVRLDKQNGPVRSLDRAMKLAHYGDTVVLANNQTPYYGSLKLTGRRHSGDSDVPFRVLGNGATISGARSIPRRSWTKISDRLWTVSPAQLGHFLLLRDEKPLPRHKVPVDQAQPTELPAGHWCACRGRVFYHALENEIPPQMPFALAQDTTGISLYGVRHVVISDLSVRHYRVDGVSAHDLCRNVVLTGITAIENGRAGITVSGASAITIHKTATRRNAEASVRITENGSARVIESNFDVKPTVKNTP